MQRRNEVLLRGALGTTLELLREVATPHSSGVANTSEYAPPNWWMSANLDGIPAAEVFLPVLRGQCRVDGAPPSPRTAYGLSDVPQYLRSVTRLAAYPHFLH